MSKITLAPVASLIDATTAKNTINSNSAIVQTAMDNTLSRDGTSPNVMEAPIDMNSNQVYNLPTPLTETSALRLKDLNNFIGGGTVTNIPPGGNIHQVLTKHSSTDFDVDWEDGASIVAGTNIVLTGANPTTISTSLTPTFTTVTGNLIGNASTVTTNANLTGDVTSSGNATTLTNAPVIAKVLTGYTSGTGTVAATDSILQAIQKLNGNDATNANLTGVITSVGNTTSIASQTGTGSKFVVDTNPALVTPNIGTPSAGVLTNCTGTAAGLTAGTVTTNANLTGEATSAGNAVTLTNSAVIGKVLTGYTSGAGTVAATDTILQSIQKLNGNDATNANLTGPITSVGNATSIASQTGTGTTFVTSVGPTLTGTLSTANVTMAPTTAAGGVVITGTAGGANPLTLDINAASTQNAFIRMGNGGSLTAEFQVDSAGTWSINQASVANSVFKITRTSSAANTLVLDSGGASVGTATSAGSGSILANAFIRSQGPTSGIGYATGAGGAVTQITSRATGVTLSKVSGAITLIAAVNAAVSAATAVTITVTNTTVAATDTVIVNQKSGTDKYLVFVTAVAAGSFNITWYTTGGVTNESPVFNFNVIKGVNA